MKYFEFYSGKSSIPCRAESGYSHLKPDLDGFWDKQLSGLPVELKQRVGVAFSMFQWDCTNYATRRNIAAQYDYLHDPSNEASTNFALMCFPTN